jgi:CBS domain-containing protein
MSKVCEYMSSPVITVSPKSYVKNAIDEMCDNKISSLLVKENGKYVGVITKTDWVNTILNKEYDPYTVEVSIIMSSPITTVDKNETLAKAGNLFEEHNIRHLAVTESGEIVGMLSVKDLERHYCQWHKRNKL